MSLMPLCLCSTEEECVIIEPALGAATPAGRSLSLSESPKEAANFLLHLSRVSGDTPPCMSPQEPVSTEREEDITLAPVEVKEDMNVAEMPNGVQGLEALLVDEKGPDQSNHLIQNDHKDGDHEVMVEVEEEDITEGEVDEKSEENVPSAIQTITSTEAAQGTNIEVQNHRAGPQEDHLHQNKTSPLEQYDSYKPIQLFKTSQLVNYSSSQTSPLQDHFTNIQGENYKIHKALSPTSLDVIEVHSDQSEDRDFDADGEDDKDSLSQRSNMTDESEIFDITRGNLGLLEQAIALKAEQVKPMGQRELFHSPDVHQQRYITMEDRPKHLDAIRKSYFNKGSTESMNL